MRCSGAKQKIWTRWRKLPWDAAGLCVCSCAKILPICANAVTAPPMATLRKPAPPPTTAFKMLAALKILALPATRKQRTRGRLDLTRGYVRRWKQPRRKCRNQRPTRPTSERRNRLTAPLQSAWTRRQRKGKITSMLLSV